MLPYSAPVKANDFQGYKTMVDNDGRKVVTITDQTGREVFVINYTSRDLSYEKKMGEKIAFLVSLLNGSESVSFNPDSRSYDIFEHSKPVLAIGGNGDPKPLGVIAQVVEAVKRGRGRPKKDA